jgi:hypothetical protein
MKFILAVALVSVTSALPTANDLNSLFSQPVIIGVKAGQTQDSYGNKHFSVSAMESGSLGSEHLKLDLL